MKKAAVAMAILLAIVMLAPLALTISSSFKGRSESQNAPMRVIPYAPTLENYRNLFDYQPTGTTVKNPFLYNYAIGRWFLNTAIIAVVNSFGGLGIATLMAFALSHYRFRGRRIVISLVLLSIIIPAQVVFVQSFVLVRNIGLYNSLWAAIVPRLAGAGAIWFLVQYMKSIPRAFVDLGRLDGLGGYGLVVRVIAPLAMPAIAALLAMSLVTVWGDYLWPLVVLRKPELYTIAVGVQEVVIQDAAIRHETNPGIGFAGATLAMLPGLVLFIIFQRYFLDGMFAKGGGN